MVKTKFKYISLFLVILGTALAPMAWAADTIRDSIVGAAIDESSPDITLYVATDGNDTNSGDQGKPFASLNKAVFVALQNQKAGKSTKVLISQGTYIPSSTIEMAGENVNNGKAIILEGQGSVLITGAALWGDWAAEKGETNLYSKVWSYKWGYRPDSFGSMSPKLLLRRELVFVDGKPLLPVALYEDLAPGKFYVSEPEGKLYVNAPKGVTDLNKSRVEVSINGGFAPVNSRLMHVNKVNNLVLRGLQFEKTASSQDTAVAILNATNLLIQDSTFNWNKYTGLTLGNCTNITVKKVSLSKNGGKGGNFYSLKNLVLQDCEMSGNSWESTALGLTGWDPAGLKFFRAHNVVIKNTQFVGNQSHGLWLDTDIINAYVENVVIQNNLQAGIYVEASVGPNFITNSTFTNNEGPGIYNSSAQNLTVDGCTVRDNGAGEIAIFGDVGKGRGPLVNWQDKDYPNFETKENFEAHPTNMVVKNSTITARRGGRGLFALAYDDAVSYAQWLASLGATFNNNKYAVENNKGVFLLVDQGGANRRYVDFATWQAASKVDAQSTISELPFLPTFLPAPAEPAAGQRVLQASKGTPIIDGTVDPLWNTTKVAKVNLFVEGDKANVDKLANGELRVLWDDGFLYFLATVKDFNGLSAQSKNAWEQDGVEVFLDQNYGRTTKYEAEDAQIRVNYLGAITGGGNYKILKQVATKVIDGGYTVEGKVELSIGTPTLGRVLGFDAQIEDEGKVGDSYKRTGVTAWNDTSGNGWASTANFGYLQLVDKAVDVATKPLPVIVRSLDSLSADVRATYISGESQQIQVKGLMNDKSVLSDAEWATAQVVYGSDNPTAIAIDATGKLTAGTVSGKANILIRAKHNGVSRSFVKEVLLSIPKNAFANDNINPVKTNNGRNIDGANDAVFSNQYYAEIKSGGQISYTNVDFGSTAYESLNLKLAVNAPMVDGNDFSGGTIEVRIDNPNSTPIGIVTIAPTDFSAGSGNTNPWDYGNSTYQVAKMDKTVTGTHALYLKFVGKPGSTIHTNQKMGRFWNFWFDRVVATYPMDVAAGQVLKLDFQNQAFSAGSNNVPNVYVLTKAGAPVASVSVRNDNPKNSLSVENGQLKLVKDASTANNSLQFNIQDLVGIKKGIATLQFAMTIDSWSREGTDTWLGLPSAQFGGPGATKNGVNLQQSKDGLSIKHPVLSADGKWVAETKLLVDSKSPENLKTKLTVQYVMNLNTNKFDLLINGKAVQSAQDMGEAALIQTDFLRVIAFRPGPVNNTSAVDDKTTIWLDDISLEFKAQP